MKYDHKMLIVAALIIGSATGYAISSATHSHSGNTTEADHAHPQTSTSNKHGVANHKVVTVPSEGAPVIVLNVAKDVKNGWNITLATTNFTFTPQNINRTHINGEGHAHLYIDGVKISRLYGPNYYVADYPGALEFKVTLNSNDHSEYAVNGVVINSTYEVQ